MHALGLIIISIRPYGLYKTEFSSLQLAIEIASTWEILLSLSFLSPILCFDNEYCQSYKYGIACYSYTWEYSSSEVYRMTHGSALCSIIECQLRSPLDYTWQCGLEIWKEIFV